MGLLAFSEKEKRKKKKRGVCVWNEKPEERDGCTLKSEIK